MKDALQVYWYKGEWTDRKGNIGDILTPVIIKHLTGKLPYWGISSGTLLAVGSIVEFIDHGDTVWGSGLIKPMTLPLKRDVTILAVRGHKTAHLLRNSGYVVPEIYGDPAIIMPDIYHPFIEPIYKVGYIPHYVEVEEYKARFEGHFINVINSVEDFLFKLLECETIVTSSLHAYILAEAYGIEAHYVQLSNKIIGGHFKHEDYLSAENNKEELINVFNTWYNGRM